MGFPGGSDGKESTCNAGVPGLIPWFGKIPRRRAWQPITVFLPENPMDRGAWWTQSMESQSGTRLKRLGMHTHPSSVVV